ncbi:DUF4148 domain-containing protein [Variovorax sp. J31P179]|uniref:DUF4148 domain-containing protein n=1 Tax=Variovorax sp. J31P179 TaxID=3053508 RepID=UPI00257600AA|nr:DUF4148 domain-containing protein [Variovorax sp. J31P179]MDM0085235.1 DUF4148 domain-containing protein [Variovorax sp. J31P179]
MNSRQIAIAALCGLSAFGAQAFQGEQNPLPPPPFQSMQPRAEVRAQALQPIAIGNGGTGVAARVDMADRAQVRAGARAISAEGAAAYGDTTTRWR